MTLADIVIVLCCAAGAVAYITAVYVAVLLACRLVAALHRWLCRPK